MRRLPNRSDVQFVTALPANPYDGQIIDFDTGTDGVVWRFRYDAASGSSYKWQFIGGPPLTAEVTASQTTTSQSYTDLTTAGPTVTTPLAGDYDLTFCADTYNSNNGGFGIMAPKFGAASVTDDDLALFRASNTFGEGSISRTMRRTGIAASTAIKLQYRADSNGGTAGFARRDLAVIPVRVG